MMAVILEALRIIGIFGIGFLFGIKVMLNREKKWLKEDLELLRNIKTMNKFNKAMATMAAYAKNLRN